MAASPFGRFAMLRWGCFGLLALSFSVLAQPTAAPVIKVASLRLPAIEGRWVDERERIVQLLSELRADVIVVQDVEQHGNTPNPACWLGGKLKYTCDFISADRPSQPLRRGSAVLSRLAALGDGITLLHGDELPAIAGMQRLQLQRARLNIYAASMRPADGSAIARGHQAADLRSWMDATGEGLPSLVVGDFSAPTDELVRQLPGFQPSRKNPSAKRGSTRSDEGQEHGMDVLYQVRSFADIKQQAVELPAAGNEAGSLPLGMMATLRISRMVELPNADAGNTGDSQ